MAERAEQQVAADPPVDAEAEGDASSEHSEGDLRGQVNGRFAGVGDALDEQRQALTNVAGKTDKIEILPLACRAVMMAEYFLRPLLIEISSIPTVPKSLILAQLTLCS